MVRHGCFPERRGLRGWWEREETTSCPQVSPGAPIPTEGTQPEDEIDKPCLEGERMLDNCPSINCLPTTIWMARAHGGSRGEGFVMSESQRCCLA